MHPPPWGIPQGFLARGHRPPGYLSPGENPQGVSMTTDVSPLSGRQPAPTPARGVAQKLKTKQYETIYVLRPDVDADTADKVQGRVAEVLEREKGKLLKVEAWGRRRLAYPVAKQKKGVYVYVKYIGKGGLV